MPPPGPSLRTVQRAWDDAICSTNIQGLLISSSGAHRARIFASGAPGSGALLHALPSANLGFRLSSQVLRVSVGLRLGADIVSSHTCSCGSLVQPDGHHGLSCKKSAGRQTRHHAVNDLLARAFRSVGVPAILEPPGLIRGDGKRPDGSTLIPWCNGRPLVWDFTCPDTLAPSHLPKTTLLAGAAASVAESRKMVKYADLLNSHNFAPVAIETLGPYGHGASEIIGSLGRRLVESSMDPRSGFFLRQRIDFAIQRGNALSVRGTFSSAESASDLNFDG